MDVCSSTGFKLRFNSLFTCWCIIHLELRWRWLFIIVTHARWLIEPTLVRTIPISEIINLDFRVEASEFGKCVFWNDLSVHIWWALWIWEGFCSTMPLLNWLDLQLQSKITKNLKRAISGMHFFLKALCQLHSAPYCFLANRNQTTGTEIEKQREHLYL